MAGREYSSYQRKLIDRYYNHRTEILLTRLGEIVSELYLAENDGQRKRLWQRARTALDGLVKEQVVSEAVVEHLVSQGRPEILANHLTDWLKGQKK